MKKTFNIKKYSHIIFLFFCVIVLLLGQTSYGSSIKYPFSYILDPIYMYATSRAQAVSNWSNALINAASYIEEYNQMKEEIVVLKTEVAQKVLDYEEYASLKQHISLVNEEDKYLEAKVIAYTQKGELIMNKGSSNEIKEGLVVSVGRIFVGIVSNVNTHSCLVRLPSNSSSNFEVVVVPSSFDISQVGKLDSFVKSHGVVLGSLEGIRIENMGINSTVSDGDTVLIRDERIKDILILGTLVGVSKNPASTFKNGIVSPIFDYTNLLTVYISME